MGEEHGQRGKRKFSRRSTKPNLLRARVYSWNTGGQGLPSIFCTRCARGPIFFGGRHVQLETTASLRIVYAHFLYM